MKLVTSVLFLLVAVSVVSGWRKRSMRCPSPPEGDCASVEVKQGKSSSIAWAKYVCDAGYVEYDGRKLIDCKRGRWDSRSALECVKDCGKPRPVRNASYRVSTERKRCRRDRACKRTKDARYRCNRGYKRAHGTYSSHCHKGKWRTRKPLRCVPKRKCTRTRKCATPPKGKFSSVEVKHGRCANTAWAEYECLPGYIEDVGRSQIECERGRWETSRALECVRGCVTPEKIPNTIYTTMYHADKDTYTLVYNCIEGYENPSSKKGIERLCKKGQWQEWTSITCNPLPKKCSEPEDIPHTTRRMVYAAHGYHTRYTCDPGYEIESGTRRRHCDTKTGKWLTKDYTPLKCKLSKTADAPKE